MLLELGQAMERRVGVRSENCVLLAGGRLAKGLVGGVSGSWPVATM